MPRYMLVLAALALLANSLCAQAYSTLNVNNIEARFYARGMIGMSPSGFPLHFEVPAGSDTHPLFSAHVWMGGMNANNELALAAVLYNQGGNDWFTGPLTVDGSASTTMPVVAQYDEVWRISAAQVALHLAYCQCVTDPDCDEAVEFPGYQAPAAIDTWPAHGDVGLAQDPFLAPFMDIDMDGQYDPSACDAPCSRGDQSLFFIFNDNYGLHSKSECERIGVEVHATPFAYDGPTAALSNTVFVQYRIINRGTQTLTNFHFGLFTDFDLGCADDDFIGCDVERSLWYGYNGDNDDEDNCNGASGYGPQPPAFGATILYGLFADDDNQDYAQDSAIVAFNGRGTGDLVIDNERHGLSHFMRFNNSGAATGNPVDCADFYNFLQGNWRDSSALSYGGYGYGGLVPTRYAYPDDSDPLGLGIGGIPQPPWSELTAGNAPFDRRGVGSMGPITLQPADEHIVLVAFVYARAGSGGPWASVQALQARVDSVRAFAEAQDWYSDGQGIVPCDGMPIGIGEDDKPVPTSLSLYPVPAHGTVLLNASAELAGQQLILHDASGRRVGTSSLVQGVNALDVSGLAQGIYICEVRSPKARYTGRLVKE